MGDEIVVKKKGRTNVDDDLGVVDFGLVGYCWRDRDTFFGLAKGGGQSPEDRGSRNERRAHLRGCEQAEAISPSNGA